MPLSLSKYLFPEEQLDDQLILTDMSIPKGYLYHNKLSDTNNDMIMSFINSILNYDKELKQIDSIKSDLDKLKGMFENKSEEEKEELLNVSKNIKELRQNL